METTRRRLASVSSIFACCACASPRWLSGGVRLGLVSPLSLVFPISFSSARRALTSFRVSPATSPGPQAMMGFVLGRGGDPAEVCFGQFHFCLPRLRLPPLDEREGAFEAGQSDFARLFDLFQVGAARA